jgi:hypothetical protein
MGFTSSGSISSRGITGSSSTGLTGSPCSKFWTDGVKLGPTRRLPSLGLFGLVNGRKDLPFYALVHLNKPYLY